MPVYEYRCEKCSHEYEKREGFDAPARQRCPKCRGRALRVIRPAPVVFKGSGFYVTDNRKAPAEPSSSESTPASTASDGAKAKPAEKPTESAAAS